MKTPSPLRPGERVFAFLLVVGSLFACHQAYGISGFGGLVTGGTMPMAAAAVMVVSGVLILRDTLRRPEAGAGLRETGAFLFPLRLLALVVLLTGYAIAIPQAGFVAASAVFLFTAMVLLWRGRVLRSALITAVAITVIWLVFRIVFQVVLPTGTLWR